MTAEYGFINRTAFDVYEEGNGEFVVLGGLSFRAQNGELFTVPSGFITNFASYPLVGRMVYGVNDDSRYAAVLHDYLYATQCVSRERADELFLEALESRGSSLHETQTYVLRRSRIRWYELQQYRYC